MLGLRGVATVSYGITCKQKFCKNYAAYRYTWPGRDESAICTEHVNALHGAAHAIGLHLQVLPLTDDDHTNLGHHLATDGSGSRALKAEAELDAQEECETCSGQGVVCGADPEDDEECANCGMVNDHTRACADRPMRIMVDGFAPGNETPNNRPAYICVQCQAVIPENAPCPHCFDGERLAALPFTSQEKS
jgi:hypothetical protein